MINPTDFITGKGCATLDKLCPPENMKKPFLRAAWLRTEIIAGRIIVPLESDRQELISHLTRFCRYNNPNW